jgi:hypothetical protein
MLQNIITNFNFKCCHCDTKCITKEWLMQAYSKVLVNKWLEEKEDKSVLNLFNWIKSMMLVGLLKLQTLQDYYFT